MISCTARKTIATLSLLAYVWGGLGLATQFVYCVGSDGHSGIERPHSPSHGAAPGEKTTLLSSKSCNDVPLLVVASKEQKRLSELNVVPHSVVSTFLSPVSSGTSRFARAYNVEFIREQALSHRFTVLRI